MDVSSPCVISLTFTTQGVVRGPGEHSQRTHVWGDGLTHRGLGLGGRKETGG